MLDSSLLYRNRPLPKPKPASALRPVLPDTLPEKSRAVLPEPTVTMGEPEMMMLPPVMVPTALLTPALSDKAEAELMRLVEIPCAMVKLPVAVERLTVPVAASPCVVPTVPTVKAPLLLKLRLPTPLAARLATALLA